MLSEQTKNVRSIRENKGWIIQMRVFVFILHHKESKMKMKLMFRKKACSKLIGLAPCIYLFGMCRFSYPHFFMLTDNNCPV